MRSLTAPAYTGRSRRSGSKSRRACADTVNCSLGGTGSPRSSARMIWIASTVEV